MGDAISDSFTFLGAMGVALPAMRAKNLNYQMIERATGLLYVPGQDRRSIARGDSFVGGLLNVGAACERSHGYGSIRELASALEAATRCGSSSFRSSFMCTPFVLFCQVP